eukprot:gnl/TRDRNA2_/TRDRNA2_61989_c0_seq1.p1 gnl/TRDRNA2_/TRDRNA2_61989_c0~~gnl/TRDRNA2_/TRDRNA2_61989_c0_seq1.p1  ORF type:complete len:159 (-),score=12.09 gnl/TRDRNA2_/TRDRNA2_61989_c0_seq1:100-576(-)
MEENMNLWKVSSKLLQNHVCEAVMASGSSELQIAGFSPVAKVDQLHASSGQRHTLALPVGPSELLSKDSPSVPPPIDASQSFCKSYLHAKIRSYNWRHTRVQGLVSSAINITRGSSMSSSADPHSPQLPICLEVPLQIAESIAPAHLLVQHVCGGSLK